LLDDGIGHRVEVPISTGAEDHELLPVAAGQRLQISGLGFDIRVVWIDKYGDHGRFRYNLMKELKSLHQSSPKNIEVDDALELAEQTDV